jgi:hypothetical protein
VQDNQPPTQVFKIGFAADHEEKIVRLHFPDPVEYAAVSPDAARQIARHLVKLADEVDPLALS